jgi:uncharacterized membrane protein
VPESEEPPVSATPAPPDPASEAPWWQSPRLLLTVMITAFTAVSFYAGTISFYDFQTRNSTDLTIFMQALTSTIGGHAAPFYESFDCVVKTRCSFLLVHPSPALYLAVPFYAVAPTPLTLFAFQSVGVGLAAVPLYVLTRSATRSSGKGLLAAGMYLLWAPTLGGEAFSFHLEAFLPLALLTLAALWATGHYRWGLAAALASYLVLEIAPVFAFFIGLFFLSFALERVVLRGRDAWRRRRSDQAARGPIRSMLDAVREELRRQDVRYTLAMMGASVVAAVLLFAFMNVWGARILGVPAPPVPAGLAGVFYDNSSPGLHGLGAVLTSAQLPYTAAFWLILYALVAFVPLLSPRSLIVALPWIGYTFLTDTTRYVEIGSQYSMVAAVPVFFGLAYGLERLPLFAARSVGSASPPSAAGLPERPRAAAARARRRRAYRAVWVVALGVVLVTNLVFLPIDPLLADRGVTLTEPFQAGYQDHSLVVLPGFAWVQRLVADVPKNASVTASFSVFSLFANYPNAFVLVDPDNESRWSYLPINLTGGPDDVVFYASVTRGLGPNLTANLSDPARYGLEAWVGTTTVGPLFLYARGVSGPAALYGPAPAAPTYNWTAANGSLIPGADGRFQTAASAPSGAEISTPVVANRTGELWRAPEEFLSPGTYSVHVLLSVTALNASEPTRRPVLTLRDEGLGVPDQNWSYDRSDFPTSGWTSLSLNLTFAEPVPGLQLWENVDTPGYDVAVAGVTIEPVLPG